MDYFDRMLEELKALNEKINKLREFIENKEKFEELDYLNRDLLITQYKAMETYLSVLSVRIGLNAPHKDEEDSDSTEEVSE